MKKSSATIHPSHSLRRLVMALAGSLALLGLLACGGAPKEAKPADSAPSAAPEQVSAVAIDIQQPRAIQIPGGGMGAVYLTIVNRSGGDDRLLRVETAAAAVAEIHETLEQDGVMRMVPHPEGLALPAGGTLELMPGGKHVMLIDPRWPEHSGELTLELHFEQAGTLTVTAPIETSADMMAGEGHDHAMEHDHGSH